MLRRHLDQHPVGPHRRGDIDEVKLLARKEIGRIRVPGLNSKSVAIVGQAGGISVADRHDPSPGNILPGMKMIGGKKATADESATQFHDYTVRAS